mgnify:CR=1 FL=1
MMTKNSDKKREQMIMLCMDDMVPKNHMLRLIDKAIDWTFIYELVEEKYCPDNGRPSMDPVMLIKIPFIQYLYGIKSMRQTIKEIEVNVAYRWFLGLDMLDPVPHFSTFGKNYTRRFKDTDLFEQIFAKILEDCMKFKLVDTDQIFVDSTHVKACANSKKMRKRVAHELLEDGIEPLFPYKRPMTKEGFFRKYEYAYDEYYDCYICPENHILSYQTTNREGYREYVSCGEICASCPNLHRCTESKEHIKVVTRHVWEEYMEKAEDIRHTLGNKQIYDLRKETIERIFGTAKEQHGFRYTQYIGRARMEMKAGLTFACMNLKKLARILDKREERISTIHNIERLLKEKTFLKKSGAGDYLQHQLCLQSDTIQNNIVLYRIIAL